MALRDKALLRRWASCGARRAPHWFIRLVPPVIGIVFAAAARRPRQNVLRNLRLIHGRRSALLEARDVVLTFVHFAQALTQSLAPERRLYQLATHRVRGKRHVSELVKEGRGMLIVTAHVGPWDAAAAGLATLSKAPVMMLMGPEADAEAGRHHDQVRKRGAVTVLRIGLSSLDALPALEHLAKGGILVAQIDRSVPGKKNITSTLFGEPFRVPRGLFQLAAMARVPVVPIYHAQLSAGRHLVEVQPPIYLPRRPTHSELQQCATVVLGGLESHLNAFPTQWFHFVGERSN